MPFRLVRIGTILLRLLAGRKDRPGNLREKPPRSIKKPARDRKAGSDGLLDHRDISKGLYGSRKTTLFSEKIFSRLLFLLFLTGVAFTGWLIMVAPPDGDPLSLAAISILTILFFVFLFLLLNFSSLTIRAGFEDLKVRYGVFSYSVDWIDVTGMELESERSGAKPFPGIRMRSLHDKNWKLYYSAGLPRVTLSLEGPIREFSFTTHSPEKFMTLARDCVNRKRSRAAKDNLVMIPGGYRR